VAKDPSSPRPDPAEDRLIGVYRAAESILLAQAAVLLQRALTAGGATFVLPQLRRLVQRTTAGLAAATPALISAMIAHEATQGARFADRAIAVIPGPPPTGGGAGGARTPPPGGFTAAGRADGGDFFDLSKDHGTRAAEAIGRDLESDLQDVRQRLTRLPDDIYKTVGPQGGIAQVLDNNVTPEQAQAAAWRDFTRRGVTGFTDRSGRDWALSSYVEMAVRTSSARAFNASSMARMQAVGFRYFTVPQHVHPCPLCGPWEGAILTLGPNPDPAVHTDGTVEEATAAGLFHPNCRDTLIAWEPRTQARPERRDWTGEDELRYRATQKQRALEREIRKAKAAAAHALTPEAAAEGRKDVRRAQAAIRAHLAQHPSLGRQSRREQPKLRMDVQNLTPWTPPPGPRPPFSDGSAPDWTGVA
jgi:hypothetical protein